MILVHSQKFFERYTGEEHDISITFEYIGYKSYKVTVDGDFYSNHDSQGQAFDEVEDILKYTNWSPLRPI